METVPGMIQKSLLRRNLNFNGSAGIYHPQRGKLTLKGGTIKGLTGVQMCAGELDIPADSTVEVIATGKDERGDKGAGARSDQ